MIKALLLPVFLVFFTCGYAQNLPSLLSGKNINATFSIIGFDSARQEWGIAVATNNIYVGNSTVYIEPGVGAFSVIAETEPAYALNGFEQLKQGKSIQQAIEFTRQTDTENYTRQVSGIDASGNVYAFTGGALQYWQGTAAHKTGKNFVVMGNQLADSVLAAMAFCFENTTGTLAEKLLKSLTAGQQAGGQITGKQSAALVVKGRNNEWFNQIDLRVDNSQTPFEELRKLLNYHYGRIMLNQALYAIRAGNKNRGETLLLEAEPLTEGWNGIYGKIVTAYLLLGNENKAAAIIQKAMGENPLWIENLPVFYCLYHRADINWLKSEATFTINDWQKAVQGMLNIQQTEAAIALATRILKTHPSSSYLHYLLGKAWTESGKKEQARASLTQALALDAGNVEAQQLLARLLRK